MDENKPKRRWYRKKRWWAVGLTWLAAVYPLSIGPAGYAMQRDWLSTGRWLALYDPVQSAADRIGLGPPTRRYVGFWVALAPPRPVKVIRVPDGWVIRTGARLPPGSTVRTVPADAAEIQEVLSRMGFPPPRKATP